MSTRQSKLSRAIVQLEQRINLVLFERSSSGVKVTLAGRDFMQAAKLILEQMDTLVRNAHSASSGETGRLTIGLFTSLSAGNLRATQQELVGRYPQVEISMIERPRMRLLTALRTGTIDIAIVTSESSVEDLRTASLWSERIVLALPKEHRLASNKAIHSSELRGETLLATRHDTGPAIQDLFSTHGAANDRPKLVYQNVSRSNIKCLVGAGFGISLLTESCIGTNIDELVYRVAHDDNGEIRIGYCAHWRSDNDNPALATLWSSFRDATLRHSLLDVFA